MYQRHPYPCPSDANVQGRIDGAERQRIYGPGELDMLAAKIGAEPKRVPQVPDAIGRMSACIDDLGSAMNALAARIDPVLRPVDHTAAGHGAAVPTPVRCQAASQIDDQCDRLCFITGNLRDILDRLEV